MLCWWWPCRKKLFFVNRSVSCLLTYLRFTIFFIQAFRVRDCGWEREKPCVWYGGNLVMVKVNVLWCCCNQHSTLLTACTFLVLYVELRLRWWCVLLVQGNLFQIHFLRIATIQQGQGPLNLMLFLPLVEPEPRYKILVSCIMAELILMSFNCLLPLTWKQFELTLKTK